TAALRETYDGAPRAEAEASRAAIWRASQEARPRARRLAAWLVPVVIAGAGSYAYAEEMREVSAWMGKTWRALSGLDPASGERPPDALAVVGPKRRAPALSPPPGLAKRDEPMLSVPGDAGTETATEPPAQPSRARPVASDPAPDVAPPSPLERYRRAHELHFGKRDFAAALAAWDDYLRAAPHDTFALEARYNRAVCLVRLG